jgi:hypothetical protein
LLGGIAREGSRRLARNLLASVENPGRRGGGHSAAPAAIIIGVVVVVRGAMMMMQRSRKRAVTVRHDPEGNTYSYWA